MKSKEFRYSIDRIRSQFSKNDLISSLKEYARVHSTISFGMRDYDAWNGRLATSDTFRRYFQGWGNALQAAGLRASRANKLDPRKMVGAFKDCWQHHGSVPSQRQLESFLKQQNFPFRTKSYFAFFGGLGRLAQLIVKLQNGDILEDQLFERYKKFQRNRRAISLKLRTAVLKRDDEHCVKCGANPRIDKSVKLEVDHIMPVSRGGSSAMENLQTLCFECNQGKKDRDN